MTTQHRCLTVLALATALVAAAAPVRAFEITPAVQAELDRQKAAVVEWAAHPLVIGAVREQNSRGPIPGMDNAKWKATRRSDPLVQAMVQAPAGVFLKRRIDASRGALDKAFISAARGEKVAFAEKTISYLHRGQEKFDVPMSTGKPWQMAKPWFDESLQGYAVQVAAPVLDGGKPIGVIVASVPLAHLEKIARR
jgi:hypothetical protein